MERNKVCAVKKITAGGNILSLEKPLFDDSNGNQMFVPVCLDVTFQSVTHNFVDFNEDATIYLSKKRRDLRQYTYSGSKSTMKIKS